MRAWSSVSLLGLLGAVTAIVLIAGSGATHAEQPDHVDPMLAQLRTIFTTEIEPAMALAGGCEESQAAHQRATAWQRHVALLLASDSTEFDAEFATIHDFNLLTLVRCYNEAYTRCVSLEQPSYGFEMLKTLQALAWFGEEDRVDAEKVDRCLSFSLVFNSRIEIEIAGGYREVSRVYGIAPGLKIMAREQMVEGPLDFVEATVGRPGCAGVVTGSMPATIAVRQAPILPPVASEILPPFALTITLGMPRLISHVACPAGSTPNLQWQWWWGFRTMHANELTNATPEVAHYDIRNWIQGSGQVLWFKTYVRSGGIGASSYQEVTTLELRHTPR